ncbi:hypothetical protein M918_19155 [Clostridium sp. BL8]|uniref:B12-binding domain-containing radical SAM protein n=1 Tax=Clostridium sp. BL8 TaxID=1354301 RepID=UPI000389DC53|nr:radical SAM protein [Clostridium sp. BL8]EQB89719.1 hypothetical protein M918_19155 [Clostridium sp. BL8]
MRECEVLLINLPVTFWYKKELAKVNSMPPLGILYIATVLNKNSYNTKILDLAVEYFDTKELKEYLLRCNPRLIGLSTYCESWNSQIALCELIKETLPECKIFAGGAFATFTYNEMLTKKLVDYVVLGEGEYSTLKLCKIIDGEESIDEIDGIAYLKDDEVVVRNEFTRITNLDELPIPDRDLIDVNKYLIPYTINTARGCPGDCIFCSSRAFWGKKVYLRSASNVFNEVMHLYEKYKTNQFLLADDTFTASKKRCLDFCELVKDSGIKFTWGCESRADVVDEELNKKNT